MDQQTNNNQPDRFKIDVQDQDPIETIDVTDPNEPEVDPVATLNPKKPTKKPFVLLFLALLLIGGAAAYFIIIKSDKPTEPAIAPAPVETEPAFAANRQLYYQISNRVVAYDTDTKAKTTLTDKLPVGATLLDLYADATSWRLYYQQTTNADEPVTSIYYLEKDKEAEKLLDEKGLVFDFIVNAQQRVAAYTTFASYGDADKSKTYVRQNGETTLVYESDAISDKSSESTSLKDSRYYVVDVSTDGKKLLLQRANCHNCDGGVSATAIELDVASKKSIQVHTATKPQGSINYFPGGGFLIQENSISALGYDSGPYVNNWLSLAKIGGQSKPVLSVNEATWGSVVHNPSFTFLVVETRGADYLNSGKTNFDGLYNKAGVTADDLKKVSISGDMQTKTHMVGQLGPTVGDCMSVLLNPRNPESDTIKVSVGMLCKTDKGMAYSDIDAVTYKVDKDDNYYNDPIVALVD